MVMSVCDPISSAQTGPGEYKFLRVVWGGDLPVRDAYASLREAAKPRQYA